MKHIVHFFDKLEDKIRHRLSRSPIFYGFVGGIGVVLFWRGIWHTADNYEFMSGPVSLILGTVILLMSGVFVSAFVGNRIIITGLKGEKKLVEKSEEEINTEESEIKKIEHSIKKIEHDVAMIRRHHN